MTSRIVIIAVSLLLAGPFAFSGEHTKDSLETVKKNLSEKRAVLLDVREKKEWDKGHLQDAQLLSLSELKQSADQAAFQEQLAKRAPKDKIVYCHCARGVRALAAGDILKKLGYDARPLPLGFDELREAGFPAAK